MMQVFENRGSTFYSITFDNGKVKGIVILATDIHPINVITYTLQMMQVFENRGSN